MPFFIDIVEGNVLKKNKKIFVGMIVGKYYVAKKDGTPDYDKIEKNIRLAEKYAIELWNNGFAVFTPHLNTRHFECKAKVPETVYQSFDQYILRAAIDFIFVLPNWMKSKGGRAEVASAARWGIPKFDNIAALLEWRKQKEKSKSLQ